METPRLTLVITNRMLFAEFGESDDLHAKLQRPKAPNIESIDAIVSLGFVPLAALWITIDVKCWGMKL